MFVKRALCVWKAAAAELISKSSVCPGCLLTPDVSGGCSQGSSQFENPVPTSDLMASSSSPACHSKCSACFVLCFCPSVLLAMDWLQLWLRPPGYVHQPLHHFQEEYAQSAVQRVSQPAASEKHSLQVTTSQQFRPCGVC